MAAKKDFSQVNTNPVYSAIAEATAAPETQETPKKRKTRKTYTEQEKHEFMQSMNTSGRKGVKLPRINLAFAPDLYEYAQTMSRVSGLNLTQFVNEALRQHMEEHKDTYKKAIEFRNSL